MEVQATNPTCKECKYCLLTEIDGRYSYLPFYSRSVPDFDLLFIHHSPSVNYLAYQDYLDELVRSTNLRVINTFLFRAEFIPESPPTKEQERLCSSHFLKWIDNFNPKGVLIFGGDTAKILGIKSTLWEEPEKDCIGNFEIPISVVNSLKYVLKDNNNLSAANETMVKYKKILKQLIEKLKEN